MNDYEKAIENIEKKHGDVLMRLPLPAEEGTPDAAAALEPTLPRRGKNVTMRTCCLRSLALGPDGSHALLLLLPPIFRRQLVEEVAEAPAILQLLFEAAHVALDGRDLTGDALDFSDALLQVHDDEAVRRDANERAGLARLLRFGLLLCLADGLHRLVVVFLEERVETHRVFLKHALAALQSVLALQ
jgi:hypothetical protein